MVRTDSISSGPVTNNNTAMYTRYMRQSQSMPCMSHRIARQSSTDRSVNPLHSLKVSRG